MSNGTRRARRETGAALTRRQFAGVVGKGALGALAAASTGTTGYAMAPRPTPPAVIPGRPERAVWNIVPRVRLLENPASTPPGETWRYMLTYPFQVAPKLAGLYCNIKPSFGPGQDFEMGNDILLFENFDRVDTAGAIPISRMHREDNPNAGGAPAMMAKYPGIVGFVPAGALRDDGTPHPHAGTGFACLNARAMPVDDSEGVVNSPDRTGRNYFTGSRAYGYYEIYQLAWDGERIRVSEPQRVNPFPIVGGHQWVSQGMGCALADGEDLVVGIQCIRPGSEAANAGIGRWRRENGSWQPYAYEPVTSDDNSMEPSLVRDIDGSLLFLARAPRAMGPPVRVWRKVHGSGRWNLILNQNGIANSTPITLNQAVDGTPYVLMNLFEPPFRLPPEIKSDGGISRLEPKGWRGERSTICLRSLNDLRDAFNAPIIVSDPRAEFGLPPHGSVWAADHPVASVVRLGDGQWHSLVGYRMLEWLENTHFVSPTPHTGSYLDEVLSIGAAVPTWRF